MPSIDYLDNHQNIVQKFLGLQKGNENYIQTEEDKKKYTLYKTDMYYYFKKLKAKLSFLIESQKEE